MSYRIGEVAKLSRISVRTLRHYDDIGLLCPSQRSEAGYRLYSTADLVKLKQILFFKTLGFTLEAIDEAIHNPTFDFRQALIEQRQTLLDEQKSVQQVLTLIDNLLNDNQEATAMNNSTNNFSMFDDFDPSIYAEEVEQSWGETDSYRESQRRTSQYSDKDWQVIKSENNAILNQLATLLKKGIAPDDSKAIAAIEAYRLHIDKWYYPCSKTMHAELGSMYVNDQRFKANFEKIQPGLATFICDAATANTNQSE